MDYKHYIRRIGIADDELPVNYATLALLQKQHLFHVPFENIDIHNKVPIVLNIEAFYQKIVLNKRGGYCYECNGLFYALLSSLGFEVHMISCRVFQRKDPGPEFDHLALIVTIEGQAWLVDVGFGDFSTTPLLIGPDNVSEPVNQGFRVMPFGQIDDWNYLSAAKWNAVKNEFSPVYIFTTIARALADFGQMNEYQQTSPASHFTRNLLCSLPTSKGRISLINNHLIITQSGKKEDRLLYGTQAIENVLTQYFGMPNTSLVFALEIR